MIMAIKSPSVPHRLTYSRYVLLTHYLQYLPRDESLILDEARPREEDSDSDQYLIDGEVMVYDSTGGGGGLSEEVVAKHLQKTRDRRQPVPVDDSKICVVCQDSLFPKGENTAVLDCGHDFHARCIKTWLIINNLCPLCKAQGIRL